MQILSYVLSISGFISMVVASLIKGEKMKKILFFVFLGNFLVATSYLLDGTGLNGAASCYLGSVQAIVTYFYDSKNIPLPKWMIALFALSFIGLNLWVGGVNPLTFLAIVATMTFIAGIGQKNGAKYRFWTLTNLILWCTYDVISHSSGALTSHILILIFNVTGMVIHDRKKHNEKEL